MPGPQNSNFTWLTKLSNPPLIQYTVLGTSAPTEEKSAINRLNIFFSSFKCWVWNILIILEALYFYTIKKAMFGLVSDASDLQMLIIFF